MKHLTPVAQLVEHRVSMREFDSGWTNTQLRRKCCRCNYTRKTIKSFRIKIVHGKPGLPNTLHVPKFNVGG